MRPVAVVIPNWNGSALLGNLLEKLRRQTHPIDRIIVVDNGSSDDSVNVSRNAGAEVIHLVVVLDRGEGGEESIRAAGIPYSPLYRVQDLELD